jgi:hypothetical protein
VGRERIFVDLQGVAEGERVAMKGRTTSSLFLTDITWPRAGVTHASLQIGILTAESRAYLLPHREVFVLDYAQTEQSVLKLSSHTVIHTTHKVQRNDFETGNTLTLLMGAKNAWLALETQDSIYSMGFRISFIVLDRDLLSRSCRANPF